MRLFLKKFLILILIITLSIPSFSAVSVSDGSAFVSKAEFSTDMNNLSNRMAQLENSLDAKIDSLVSSYLSRNGIWNGEKQTVDNKYVKVGVSASVTSSKTFYYCRIVPSTTVSMYGEAQTTTTDKNYQTAFNITYTDSLVKVCDNITKSGLLFLDGYIYQLDRGFFSSYFHTANDTISNRFDIFQQEGNIVFSNTTTNRRDYSFSDRDGQNFNTTVGAIVSVNFVRWNMFVTKGMPLYVKTNFTRTYLRSFPSGYALSVLQQDSDQTAITAKNNGTINLEITALEVF